MAAAEGHVRASRICGFLFGALMSLQVRALELEAAEAKRDAGDCFYRILVVTWLMTNLCVLCAGKMQATLRQTERQLIRLQVGFIVLLH